jgi:hypothetical protein
MKKLRLLAPLAVVATLMGLSACGGGGDAGEPLAPLTAGLTVTASTGNVPADGTYNLTVDAGDVGEIGEEPDLSEIYYAQDQPPGNVNQTIELHVQVDKSTRTQLQKMMLVDKRDPGNLKYAGCGFSGFSCGNNVTINTSTSEVRISRTQLKKLVPGGSSNLTGDIFVHANTAVDTNGGSLTASGILAALPG